MKISFGESPGYNNTVFEGEFNVNIVKYIEAAIESVSGMTSPTVFGCLCQWIDFVAGENNILTIKIKVSCRISLQIVGHGRATADYNSPN